MSKEIRDMFDSSQPRMADRRRGLDKRGKIGLALSIVGWSLWGVGMYMVYFATPQSVTYFDILYNKSPNTYWKPEYLYVSEGIWALGVIICLLSLAQFRKRYKRKTDKRHTGILTALVCNAASFLAFGVFMLYMSF